jgi:hypothetical protein
MNHRAEIAPTGPQVTPPVDCRDDLRRLTSARPIMQPILEASGADRRVLIPPATHSMARVIMITGIGDHRRLDQPISFTGIRSAP